MLAIARLTTLRDDEEKARARFMSYAVSSMNAQCEMAVAGGKWETECGARMGLIFVRGAPRPLYITLEVPQRKRAHMIL